MSKMTPHPNPKTRGDELSDSLDQAQEDDLQMVFNLRLKMARAHAAKTRILRGQLAALQSSYASQRLRTDRQLVEPQTLELIKFTSAEIINKENLPAYACGPLADAKRNLRKLVLDQLLDNLEKIVADFRFTVSSAGREVITYGNLARYIFEYHLAETSKQLSPADSHQLRRHCGIANDRLQALLDAALSYPILENQTLSIHKKDEVDAFCGHLIACISGRDGDLYNQFKSQFKSIQRELSQYSLETSGLPGLESLGAIGEQMRIHLLCKIFHDRVEQETVETQEDSGKNYPRILLEHYEDFGKSEQTEAQLAEFEALPGLSLIMEGIHRVLNKNTRRKMIEQSSKQQIAPTLLEKIYQMMCVIYDLEQLGQAGNEEASVMAGQFGHELITTFQKTANIKKPADPSIIEGLFPEMTNMIQLARYCYQELSRA